MTDFKIKSEMAAIPAILVGSLVSKAFDFTVDRAVAALNKAAANEEVSYLGREASSLYTISEKEGKFSVHPNANLECIQIIVGRRATPAEATSAGEGIQEALLAATGKRLDPDQLSAFLEDIRIGGRPRAPIFVAEFHLKLTPDHSAFRLRPALVYYPERLGNRPANLERQLAVLFAINRPGADEIAAAAIAFPAEAPGYVIGPGLAKSFDTNFLPFPQPSDATLQRALAMTSVSLRDLQAAEYVDISLTVVETTKGSAWAKALAEVLGGAKDELKDAVLTEIDPTKRKAKASADLLASLTNSQELVLAKLRRKAACDDWLAAKASNSEETAEKWRAYVEVRFAESLASAKSGEIPERFNPEDEPANCPK